MKSQKYTIRWTDKDGHSYSVTANSFVDMQALDDALLASTEVTYTTTMPLGGCPSNPRPIRTKRIRVGRGCAGGR